MAPKNGFGRLQFFIFTELQYFRPSKINGILNKHLRSVVLAIMLTINRVFVTRFTLQKMLANRSRSVMEMMNPDSEDLVNSSIRVNLYLLIQCNSNQFKTFIILTVTLKS